MGLAERRATEEYQKNQYPELQKKLYEAAGFEFPIEIHWERLAREEYADIYNDAFTRVYFEPMTRAIRSITSDETGKKALKNGLKKVVIDNSAGASNPELFSFEDGVLLIDHDPISNAQNEQERETAITKLLERKL